MHGFEMASGGQYEMARCRVGMPLVSLLLALSALSCRELDPTVDTCISTGVCEEDNEVTEDSGLDPDPSTTPWGCLTNPYRPPAERPENVLFAMAVVDFNNPSAEVAIPGLNIQVCQPSDLTCAQPLTGTPQMPGPIRVLQMVPDQPPPLFLVGLPFGFNGYLRLNAPGFLQTEYYFFGELGLNFEGLGTESMPPLVRGETITLPQEDRIAEFFDAITRTPRDVDTGIVALRTFDCQGNRAADVSLEILSDTTGDEIPWVFSQGYPLRDTKTDSQGVAGFANLSPSDGNTVRIQGINPSGIPYGSVTLPVRASTLTFAEVRPAGAYKRSPMQSPPAAE